MKGKRILTSEDIMELIVKNHLSTSSIIEALALSYEKHAGEIYTDHFVEIATDLRAFNAKWFKDSSVSKV